MHGNEHAKQFDPQRNLLEVTDVSNQRRRTGRLGVEMLQCSLGRLLDLSAGGLRVNGPAVPVGSSILIRITSEVAIAGDAPIELTVKGRVAWSTPRRKGLFESGIEFVEVTPEQRARLTQVANACRCMRSI